MVLKIRASEKMLQNNVLSEIGALQILREKIEKIKQYLRENLTEELVRIVYLTDDVGRVETNLEAPNVNQLIFDKSSGLENLGFNKDIVLDEPFYHMQEIIEVLYHLSELDISLKSIKDRITVDVYNVVSQVIQEVEIEYPSCSDKNIYIDDGDDCPQDHVIIHRLLNLLYERMFAVVEGHLFIFRCIESIQKEFNVEPSIVYSKREVAAAIQNEVKALLYDYLSGAVDNSNSGTSIVALTEMLKETYSKEKLRVNKQLFHIKQVPDDSLTRELKMQCGYQVDVTIDIPESPSADAMQLDHILLESFVTAIQSGHKMLVPSAVSHILVCFEPTVIFMRQLEHKIGMNLVNFNVFLTDFIMNIYLPHIQEQILIYHHANINGIDAFQAEKCPAADYPLIKSSLCMVLATHGICRLIKMMPIHSEELVKVLIKMLEKYQAYCSRRLNSICKLIIDLLLVDSGAMDEDVAIEDPEIISLKWAKNPAIRELLAQNTFLTSDIPDVATNTKLCDLETVAELKLLGDRSIHRLDLLPESRRLLNLGHLTYGLDWMLTQMNYLVTGAESSSNTQNFLMSKSTGVLKAFANMSDDSLFDSADIDFQKTDLVIPSELKKLNIINLGTLMK